MLLKDYLGVNTFRRAFQAFLSDWAYKHPYPWDLFNTFERETGENLEWFWRSWFYETWTLDHGIKEVKPVPNGTTVIVSDEGKAVMPATVSLVLQDGGVLKKTVPVSVWLDGNREHQLTFEHEGEVKRVEVDADFDMPDTDRRNNMWVPEQD